MSEIWAALLRAAALCRPASPASAKDRRSAATPVSTWRDYLTVHYLRHFAAYLPKRFDDRNFAFYGTVLGGNLELSNVDVAAEFTQLIVNQRGYQANSRVVTTADSLLQETLNLIR